MDELWDFLIGLFHRHKRRAVGFRWTVKTDGGTITFAPQAGDKAMALLLTDTQKVTLSIQPVDAKGFPAKVDGVPVWSVSDGSVANLVAAADGLSCEVFAGFPGTAQVVVEADADLGAGVTPLTGTLDLIVEAGAAVSLVVTAGVPSEQ
jgi:hypothetical protein